MELSDADYEALKDAEYKCALEIKLKCNDMERHRAEPAIIFTRLIKDFDTEKCKKLQHMMQKP